MSGLPFTQAADFAGQQVGGLEAQVVALADQLQRPLSIYETANAILHGFGGQAVRLTGEQRWQAQHVSRAGDSIGNSWVAVVRHGKEPHLALANHQHAIRRLSLTEQNRAGAASVGAGDGIQRCG